MLKQWRQDYMPQYNYLDLEILFKNMTVLETLRWSLNKWMGLLPEVKRTYNIQGQGNLRDIDCQHGDETVRIDYTTCPLCYHADINWDKAIKEDPYLRSAAEGYCNQCPIFIHNGITCEDNYSVYTQRGDPRPMIKLLQITLNKQEEEEASELAKSVSL